MRIKLKVQQALELARARKKKGLSQYELAEQLGWPRSKIKRIEKAEVQSIEEEDLKTLRKKLNVKESATKRASSKKRSSRKKEKSDRSKGPRTDNQRLFLVKMLQGMKPEELIGEPMRAGGVSGHIHGVENTKDQDPLKAGDEVVLMMWGPGIGDQRPGARARKSSGQ